MVIEPEQSAIPSQFRTQAVSALSAEDKPWFKNWPSACPKTINTHNSASWASEQTHKDIPEKVALAIWRTQNHLCPTGLLFQPVCQCSLKLGVEKGDRVALFLPNIPQFVIAFFGALKAGAVVTTISPLHREREVEYQLCDSGAQTIVAFDSLYSSRGEG